jgi:hypothetical protein
MTTSAKTNFGAAIWMAADGVTPLVKVAELINVTPPTRSREMIDATTHDSASAAQEFIAEGIYDPGEVTGQINYIAGSAGDDAFITAVTGGGLHDFKIVAKASTGTEDITFSGYVTSYGVDDLPTNGKQTASFTIKVSGAISQAASA